MNRNTQTEQHELQNSDLQSLPSQRYLSHSISTVVSSVYKVPCPNILKYNKKNKDLKSKVTIS